MTHTPIPLDQLLDLVQSKRLEREVLEAALAECRLRSRTLSMSLIFDYGYSLGKTEALTGHMRPTLRLWVQREAANRDIPAFKPLGDS